MSWKKKLYEFLESSKDEGAAELLKSVKSGLSEMDEEAGKHRTKAKDLETELEETKGEVAKIKDELQTASKKAGEADEKNEQLDKALGRIKKLEDDAVERDEKNKKLEKETAKNELRKAFITDMQSAFGTLTGELLTDKYIDSGKVTRDEKGTLQLMQDGVTYEGKEVMERIRTDHKDSIVGKGGNDTRPGAHKTEVKPENMAELPAHKLFEMSLEQQQ